MLLLLNNHLKKFTSHVFDHSNASSGGNLTREQRKLRQLQKQREFREQLLRKRQEESHPQSDPGTRGQDEGTVAPQQRDIVDDQHVASVRKEEQISYHEEEGEAQPRSQW